LREPPNNKLGVAIHALTLPNIAVSLSAGLIRAMGFRPFLADESITASFVSLSVYETRGIALQSLTPLIATGEVAGVNYRVGIGGSLNETCQVLSGDEYTEDVDTWMKEKRTSGPYLLLEIGPTAVYTVTTGQIKTESDGSLTTYETFPALRTDLAALETKALPRLVASLSCSLAPPDQYLELRKLDRVRVGQTDSGLTIHDIRIVASGSGYGSLRTPPEALVTGLQESLTLAPRINVKAARFFALGMAEEVDLKKFLYFFLALEVETHAVFGRIDQLRALQRLLDPASTPLPAALALLRKQTDQIRNLYDRFVWNAACAWIGITEEDVQQFKQLKTARDDIAHGKLAEPPGGYAHQAQQMARKILRM
jgi:hypothetical protein